MKQSYTVTEDADMIAPGWLTARVNYSTIKFLHSIQDGAERLKGVRIDDQIARIGDTIIFDGKRLSIERK